MNTGPHRVEPVGLRRNRPRSAVASLVLLIVAVGLYCLLRGLRDQSRWWQIGGFAVVAFVLAVLFGANMSYIVPTGYQTNLIVMSAGGYRFSDFFRIGIPLQIILWLMLSILLPWLYL
jgi:Na+/H+ antiporter NhaD/arsenite permease-like protein